MPTTGFYVEMQKQISLNYCKISGVKERDILNEPDHEKMCLMSYANNKGADQPAHPHSLISVFVVRCLDSVMSLVSVTKISSLMLASVAEQASLSLTWLETPEDTFSHDEAQMLFMYSADVVPYTPVTSSCP